MHASIQGGLWALLLSSTGLAFASVVDDANMTTAEQFAIQIEPPAPLNVVDIPVAAMANTPEASTVVAGLAPLAPAPVAPEQPEPVKVFMAPPVTVAATPGTIASPTEGSAPQLPRDRHDPPVILTQIAAPAAPERPAWPLISTEPAPVPARMPVQQAPNRQPAGNLIVRVQALGTGGTGVQTNRLPQITPPEPEAEAVVAEEVAPAPDTQEAAPETDTTAVVPEPVLPGGGGAPTTVFVPLDPLPEEPAEPEVTEVAPETAEEPADTRAIARFAAPFERIDDLPMIGLVLVDDGTMQNGPQALFNSGLTATVAVSALAPDAGLFADAYTEAGMEVALQVPLPDGATPVDVEVAFAAALDILPAAAMLYSNGRGVLRNDRQAAGQVLDILAADGHGFVTISNGLGGPLRTAEALGLPAAAVTRDLDEVAGSAGAIGRTLDRAAFEARRSGGAIISATLSPEMIAILQDWAPDGVLVGPASAILLQPEADEEPPTEAVVTTGLPQIEETAPEVPDAPQTGEVELQDGNGITIGDEDE